MGGELERIKVKIVRINSPADFWVQLESRPGIGNQISPNSNETNGQSSRKKVRRGSRRGPFIWKCHLALVAPTLPNAWSLTATDKFRDYSKRFDQLAITLPSMPPSQFCRSTAVVLWGVIRNRKTNALEAMEDTWMNINLQLVFQGVARSTVDIEIVEHCSRFVIDFEQPTDKDAANEHPNRSANFKKKQLPAAEPCSAVEVIGTPVHIDNELSIFIQEPHHQSRVREMSIELSEIAAANDGKRKRWNRGELCVAKLNDGTFYRAQIKSVYGKEQKCKVLLVDIGRAVKVTFENLSKISRFANVPIQVQKFHLLNVTLIPNNKIIQRAKNLVINTIQDRECSIYIHENTGQLKSDSIPCTICTLDSQVDLASLLVGQGQVEITSHVNRANEFDAEKRIRKDCEEPILKPSAELKTVQDFELFYKNHKLEQPFSSYEAQTDERAYEGFAPPSKRSPLTDNESKKRQNVHDAPDLMVDRITKHFKLLQCIEREFNCQAFHVIDPVTILIIPEHSKIPQIDATQQRKNPLLSENTPCIAYVDHNWRRGIVWQKISTNKYKILLVDTLTIVDVKRGFVQNCPQYLLHSKVQYMKVRLSRITPNTHLRVADVCDQLSSLLFDNNGLLFAKVTQSDGPIPEIRLYATDTKKSIYNALVNGNFYKKLS